MKSIVNTNTKVFMSGLVRCKSELATVTAQAMKEGMEIFKMSCLNDAPSCPVKLGNMYRAHEVSVSSKRNGAVGTLTVDGIPYAASQHEGVSRWGTAYQNYTRPGSGSHWISSKILRVSTGGSPVFRAMIRSISHFFRRVFRR